MIVKKSQFFALFNGLLKTTLMAVMLCFVSISTVGAVAVCSPISDANFYSSSASNANLDGCMYITLADTPALYTVYATIQSSQTPLEITFSATAAPGPSVVLSAQGVFFIRWGNGSVLRINKTDTSPQRYFFGSSTSGTTTVKIYSNTNVISNYNPYCPAITFNPHNVTGKGQKCGGGISSSVAGSITSVGGCLGCVFPTLSSGTQPLFIGSFANLPNLTNIPGDNFFYDGTTGITGQAINYQFAFMFHNDTSLQNTTLPSNYFNGLTKAGISTFYGMFSKDGVADISGDAWSSGLYCIHQK